tara:strand:+ start:513 stop:1256 length:744 start_codon:yes stop_codon:yes gene_type:complete
MHGSVQNNEVFLEELLSTMEDISSGDYECGIAIPSIYLFQFSSRSDIGSFHLGAQNVAQWRDFGAYTGEINAKMLLEFDCKFSIVGHSERRKYFGETNEIVATKANHLLDCGIVPLVCVGEDQQERENDAAVEFVTQQVEQICSLIGPEKIKKCIFAYEPIWAIGSGKVAAESDIKEMHEVLRNFLESFIDENAAHDIPLLYGGSVSDKNVISIVQTENVDGVLVGGASVSMETFGKLLQNVSGNHQ